jgi:hypothetical protein
VKGVGQALLQMQAIPYRLKTTTNILFYKEQFGGE